MSAKINIYNPKELGAPMGQYTHVTRVRANEFLFVAGMLSGDAAGNVIGEGEFEVQTAQVFRNIEAALKSAGASWANVVKFTTYLVHSQLFCRERSPRRGSRRSRDVASRTSRGSVPHDQAMYVRRGRAAMTEEPIFGGARTVVEPTGT